MNNYLSRAEIEDISEGLIETYSKVKGNSDMEYVDIVDLAEKILGLKLEFVSFAEEDPNKVGFLSDGKAPILIHMNGKRRLTTFPKKTVLISTSLQEESERGRRRFTIAHEVAHYILNKLNPTIEKACFHTEYSGVKQYTKEELVRLFASTEWQADALAASLLMPKSVMRRALTKFTNKKPIKRYGDATFSQEDKETLRRLANVLGVSVTALLIRLKNLNMIENRPMKDYLIRRLELEGGSRC